MDNEKIVKAVDHTLLQVTSTWEEIKAICDDGMQYGVASLCIPPAFVKQAKDYVGNRQRICTVIGFPNGYNTTEVKVFETKNAIENGADEIDMVINIGDLKSLQYDKIEEEIKELKKVCNGKTLKVIVETCLLTEDEKIKMCEIVSKSGADFIKTSTGFSTGGATREDIKLFAENVSKNVSIKASGGIKSMTDAEDFINLGASRLGTSSIIKILKNEKIKGY